MISKALSVGGPLNAFQKVMLQWSALHPYNATHTYKIAGSLRANDLRAAIRDTYLAHGLGIVHLSPDGQSFRHELDQAPEIAVLAGGAQPENCLAEHVTRELNRSFERPTCRPFRFNAMETDRRFHYITLCYDHWVADSTAARMLMRNILGRYLGLPIPENDFPVQAYAGTYREVFRRALSGPRLALAAARSLRQWNRNRKAWQVAYWSSTQWAVNHHEYQTIPGTVARLHQFARSLDATVHDVILAALGRAMAQSMPSRGKDRELALGSIVDTRAVAEEDLSRTFGTFLSYYMVRNKPDPSAGLDEMTRRVAALTRPIKQRRGYLDSLVNMQFINMLWPWLPESVKPYFMRGVLPMTAGVSNVLLREPWIDRNRDVILDYSRAASTGPGLPLVLTPTTLGDQMNFGVTYRVAGFPRAKIDAVMDSFLQQIEHPNKASRGGMPRRKAEACPIEHAVLPSRQPVLDGAVA